jgi:uracil-DNA glycosylase
MNIPAAWDGVLRSYYRSDSFDELLRRVQREYDQYRCHPEKHQVFQALEYCAPEDVRVVILGQDPYPTPGDAHGLAFSVNDGVQIPRSLKNIFKEIQSDIGSAMPVSGNLRRWAEQGVFLLNTHLTVRSGKAGSHRDLGWEELTTLIIQELSKRFNNIVFLLWGNHAKRKEAVIDGAKHLVLSASHPSPLSANRGGWFGCRHFSQANDYLRQHGKHEIVW